MSSAPLDLRTALALERIAAALEAPTRASEQSVRRIVHDEINRAARQVMSDHDARLGHRMAAVRKP